MIEPCPFRRRLDRFLFAVLAAIPCVLMLQPLMAGAVPYFMDPLMYFYPLRVQAARVWAAGEWPLWNRAIMGGMPLLENPQAAIVYPLNWPSLWWPTGFWFTFPQLMQLGLYGALTAWALRRLEVTRWVAAWAGLLAICGDYGWSRLQFGNYMNVLPWWGLWFGSVAGFLAAKRDFQRLLDRIETNEKEQVDEIEISPPCEIDGEDSQQDEACGHRGCRLGAKPPKPTNPALLAGIYIFLGSSAVAMLLLGGAHQPAFYALAAFSIFAFIQGILDRRRAAWLQFVLITFIFGIVIAGPGWLPQISFIRETSRVEGVRVESILAGSVHSFEQLFYSLAGDWRIIRDFPRGERWGDAEAQTAIGVLALLLALVPAGRGVKRNAWIGLWIAALVTIVLACRPVVAWLIERWPVTGIFHDPRRWLGITQWLLLLAAALGADRLIGIFIKRFKPGILIVAVILIAAVASQAYVTWRTTDLAMISVDRLFNRESLLSRIDLPPGERFFTIDYKRDVSYDFRRPDLLEWALPNSAMLLGHEDLGGYEPAQSRRWREYMATLLDDPARRLWPDHFALTVSPWTADLPATASVGAMVAPRWGIPLYFRQVQQGLDAYGAFLPSFVQGPIRVVAIMVAPPGTRTSIRESGAPEAELLAASSHLNHIAELALEQTTATARIHAPLSAPMLSAAVAGIVVTTPAATIPPITVPPPDAARPAGNLREELAASTPTQEQIDAAHPVVPVTPPRQPWILTFDSPPVAGQQRRLLDVYFWNDDLARQWHPIFAGEIAALFVPALPPQRTHWAAGGGDVLSETIKNNSVQLDVNVTTGPARLILHDAWWRWWEASLDGKPLEIQPAGPWRQVALPAGRHTLIFRYSSFPLGFSVRLSPLAIPLLCMVSLLFYGRGRKLLRLARRRRSD